ncbi:MAG: hypothetical protein J0H14_09810 [Alphaproteobacteria bacterium]|nr:hypothetical protein [Alphaproteobacteria bacterium]
MLAIGCLLPLVLMVVGGLFGAWLGGGTQAPIWWGIGGGFVVGSAGMAFLLWGFERIRGP